MCITGVSFFLPAFCLCHRHLSFSASVGPFTHCLCCFCALGCGRLRGLCVVSSGFLQGCAGGCSVGHGCGRGVLRWAGTGFLCWCSVLAPCAAVRGVLLGVPASLDVVTCALPGMLCLPGAPLWHAGVCCQRRCPGCGLCGGLLAWFCQLSCAVCPVFILCAAADCVRVVCSNYCSLLPVVYGRFCVLMLLVLYAPGPQCTATHALFNKLGYFAADSGRATKGGWIEGALRRLSVALCKGNDFVFHANLHSFCCATGKHLTRGAAVPHTLEV